MKLKEFLNEKDIMGANEVFTTEELLKKKFDKVKKLEDGTFEVWGDFFGNPEEIGFSFNIKIFHGVFQCFKLKSETLTNCPEFVDGKFDCSYNKTLTTLKGGPKIVKGKYDCSACNLQTLKGVAEIIGGDFDCSNNNLKTLKKGPKIVKGDYLCDNNLLESLKGCPKVINGYFYCYNNKLTSLKEGPIEVKRNYVCYNNIKQFTKEEVESICKVGGEIKVFEES